MSLILYLKKLRDEGVLLEDQLVLVCIEAEKLQEAPHLLLLDFGFISHKILFSFLEKQTGIPYREVEQESIQKALQYLDFIPLSFWEKIQGFPFYDTKTLCVGMVDPLNIENLDFLEQTLFSMKGEAFPLICFVNPQCVRSFFKKAKNINDSFFEKLIKMALDLSVSDIHFEPNENKVHVRLRMDGILKTFSTLTFDEWDLLLNQLKIEARLDISEKRRSQSAHLTVPHLKEKVNFRLSTHPTLWGESVALRMLYKNKHIQSLDDLGFHTTQTSELLKAIRCCEGLILVCGPTGSGKTTTLYSLLACLNSQEKNIMTLEDPVEYRMKGVRQTEIQQGIISFEEGIRSVLRQDVDVLLVGEIRDQETAFMTCRASLTGHLILSTIHASSCFSVFHRLLDFNIPLHMILSTVRLIVSQRLVRKVCLKCLGQGCSLCFDQGFLRRTVIAEVLPMSEDLERILLSAPSLFLLKQWAKENGFFSIKNHACFKIEKGETTYDEVEKVITF